MFKISPIIASKHFYSFAILIFFLSLFNFNLWVLGFELTFFIWLCLALQMSDFPINLEFHQSLLYVYYGFHVRAFTVVSYWQFGPLLLIFSSGPRIIIFQWQLPKDHYHELIWQLRQMTF
jgi:hypothetical protein